MDPLTAVSTRTTPQSQPATPEQIPNSAGGYGFPVSDAVRVHRFLVLGVEGGTYYATERELTKDNAEVILRAARERTEELVGQILAVSTGGRAPRQQPAIFALAAASALGDETGRKAALEALPLVCRTGTHLFLFARYVEQFRGWGRGLRRAVGAWYLDKPVEDVAYQVIKYRQRAGVAQRDLLRLAHPETDEVARRALFNWAVTGDVSTSRAPGGEERPVGATHDDLPDLVRAYERAQAAEKAPEWVELIERFPLPWEAFPDAALTEPKVWRALIAKGMPQTALMRQLPRLTRLGVLDDVETERTVIRQLADRDRLLKARVHPVNVLVALRTYASGLSQRGESTWEPKRRIIDALDQAFYAAFGAVQPADKRTLVALDVSGSMGVGVAGLPLSCREAAAAMSLVTLATEPHADIVGFTSSSRRVYTGDGIAELSISPRQRLDDVVRYTAGLPFGGTDCSLPMLWALKNARQYETFVVITDNETWAGAMHPHQALQQYRERMGIPARLVVMAMSSTGFSIADPADAGMLDIAGLDAAAPTLVADFSRGTV